MFGKRVNSSRESGEIQVILISPLSTMFFNHKSGKSRDLNLFQLFPKRQILDSSKLKEFEDDNFKFDENGREFSKRVENSRKRRNCSL